GDPGPGDAGVSPHRLRAARAHPRARLRGHRGAERVPRHRRALRDPGHPDGGAIAMKHARSLIVNADDYGLTAGVSRGILDSHRRGIVTSTDLLAYTAVKTALLDELKGSGMVVVRHMS